MKNPLGHLILVGLFFITISLTGCKDSGQDIKVSLKDGGLNKNPVVSDNKNNSSSKDSEKLIEEQQQESNTPSREDLTFTEELKFGGADLEEVKKKGGLEVGRGNVYNYGIPSKFKPYLAGVLNEYESERVFYVGDGAFNFFYFTENSFKEVGKEYKDNGYEFTKKTLQDGDTVLDFKKGIMEGQLIYYPNLKGDGEVVGTALGIMKGSYVAIYRNPTEEEMKKFQEAIKENENKNK